MSLFPNDNPVSCVGRMACQQNALRTTVPQSVPMFFRMTVRA